MSNRKFTILSFVGGGIRGLMSVTMLQKLYDLFPNQNILEHTDLIAGCSTGSIITSELLAGTKPSDLITFFKTREVAFYDKMNTDPDKPAYSIDEVFGSQAVLQKDRKVSDITSNKVLFVTFNKGGVPIEGGIRMPKPWRSIMYTNMEGGDGGDVLVAKAATSSGAMPGQLGSYEGNVDGAFLNHDPTLAAIALAVHNGHALEDIAAITIGTGLMHDWIASDTHDWGATQWMNGVANPFNNATPFLMNQSKSSPVLDMALSGTSWNLMPGLVKLLLGERYVNLNPELPCFIPENSTYPQAISLLERKGAEVDTRAARELLRTWWFDNVVG